MFRAAQIFAVIALAASAQAQAANYSSNYGPVVVQQCPSLPPDQLRIAKPMPQENPCAGNGTSVVVMTDYHLLYLCENGQQIDNYDIAYGSNGTGKTAAGDRKTPLGTYSLGEPRKSDEFGIFIPVGYPTKAQVAKGFTGDAVGIHGPVRQFRCVGFLNVVFDWTAGCMAVADDGYIARIANWVKAHPRANLHIY